MPRIFLVLLMMFVSTQAFAENRTWRNDIQPVIAAQCGGCHGADAPEYNDWRLLDNAERKSVSPRMDTYPHFMSYVVWPATGAMMRRLDDGKVSGKVGNMYQYLGDDDVKRARNLALIKEWLGENSWNLNRWKARENVPGITKEQLENIKAKY